MRRGAPQAIEALRKHKLLSQKQLYQKDQSSLAGSVVACLMSSDLFRVRILSRKGSTVLVEVTDTYHDISAPETEAFFFAALYEPARDTGAPLDRACTVEQICDEDFVEGHLRDYIASVEVVEARSPAQATYKVVFTDPKWAEHLRPKLTWGTASYDIGEPDLRRALDKAASRAPARAKRTAKVAKKTAAKKTAVKRGATKKTASKKAPAKKRAARR